MDFDFTSFEFIPVGKDTNSNNLLVIHPQKIVINLDDPETKRQFDDFKDFYALDEHEGTGFFRFAKQIVDSYDIHYSIVHKDEEEDDNTVKINLELDTSSIDNAIAKVDLLISKLKTAQSLMSSISNK